MKISAARLVLFVAICAFPHTPFGPAEAFAAAKNAGVSASSSNAKPTVLRYSNPAAKDDPNYALTVLRREPQFTEAELLRYCDDVYPVAGQDPNAMLGYMTTRKGWESDRVYYMMTKIVMAEGDLAAKAAGITGTPVGRQPEMAPGDEELRLVERHHARIPAAFSGGRVMDNTNDPAYVADATKDLIDPFSGEEAMRTVLANNPEFTEAELSRALADMAGGERLMMDDLVAAMQKKGWTRNRAFYMAFRIRISVNVILDKNARGSFTREMPAGLPTPKEETLMKQHLPASKAARYVQ